VILKFTLHCPASLCYALLLVTTPYYYHHQHNTNTTTNYSGADVNAADLLGRTALKVAISERQTSLIDLLVENGADLPPNGIRSGKKVMERRQILLDKKRRRLEAETKAEEKDRDTVIISPLFGEPSGVK
jgi:hypothetical protein